MGTGKEDTAVFLDRASRSTRGRRMTKLLDEEVEEDELFWNQEAFKEIQAHTYSSENTLTIFLDYRIDVDVLEYGRRMMSITKKSQRLLMCLIVTSMKMNLSQMRK